MTMPSRSWRLAQGLLRIRRAVAHRIRGAKTVYVTARREEYRAYWEAAARALGAEFAPLTDRVWEIRKNGRATRVSSWVTQCDDPVILRLAGDKAYCYGVAAALDVPVPDHVVVRPPDLAPALALLRRRAAPVVVKPLKGSASGQGITTHVTSDSALREAAVLASLYDDEILVEQLVAAESCRLLFLGGRLLSAVRRRGVRVTGDGRRTVAALLAGAGVARPAQDPVVLTTLAHQGRSVDDVPAAGEVVLGRNLPAPVTDREELRTVYDEDITTLIAPELAAELARVVMAVGSEFAGVDILTNDPGLPLAAAGGTFLEINTTPGLHHHYVSVDQLERGPAVAVLAHLLGNQQSSAPSTGGSADQPPGRRDP